MVYQNYTEPLVLDWASMSPRPGIDKLNHLCKVPWMIWNLVVHSDFYPQVPMDRVKNELRKLEALGDPAVAAMLDFWSNRKRSLFAEFCYMYRNAEFYQNSDGEMRCRAEVALPPGITEADITTQ